MKKEDISLKIEQNFEMAGWQIDELTIQPDPFTGWQIMIVSRDFEGKNWKERKDKALVGLDALQIEWMELLTPTEQKGIGSLPFDSNRLSLPLWPEALAQGSLLEADKKPIKFLSSLDEDIHPPVIATFYSLRGGVGRSTALAYTAHILASSGRKVVCVDMDLEAPGITALFGKEKEIEEEMGLIHLLLAFDQGETPDIAKHLLRVSESYDLYCLPAGKTSANYARLLRFIDPESWYREDHNPLRELMDHLCKKLPFTPDVILMDSRTGITQLSGPMLFDLSDISIIVFFPHPQARTGTEALVKALLAARTRRDYTPEIRFLVSPIPPSKAPEVVRRYEHRAVEWISDWLSPWKNSPFQNEDILETDITHFVPYLEVIATSDQILSDNDVWDNYREVVEWIERFLTMPDNKVIHDFPIPEKTNILTNFSFSTGMAEDQQDLFETFVETDSVKKALSPEIPLILGRKGTGKTAVFRRLSEGENQDAFIVTPPPALSRGHNFFLDISGFKEIERTLKKTEADWREFWTIYICLICHDKMLESKNKVPPPPDKSINALLEPKPKSSLEVNNLIEKFINVPKYGLIANDWFLKLDRAAAVDTMLLFDGLDTGFGHHEEDRKRRKEALEGLFTFITDSGERLENLKFKIMLREDIWKKLKFENKSHFFGRTAQLKWADQISFLKIVLKQAMRNESFNTRLDNRIASRDIEFWGEQEVITAWNLLVGERMRGGQTAFTRNWVWKRLADGNNDHSPRYLLQLLHEAVDWEKRESRRNPYHRSIIRPSALSKVFPEVSKQALGALRDEEFPELAELMTALTEISYTPVNASQLNKRITSHDLVNLAIEVGLLGIYDSSEEEINRYKVPEIYRYALEMTRKGQV